MSFRTILILPIIMLVGLAAALSEQEHQHAVETPEKLGEVHFPISCGPEAQQQFNRAVALLHSFWYEKAEKAFSEVSITDPTCAMAYWGIAVSLYHPLWDPPEILDLEKGSTAVGMAKRLDSMDREKAYIAAIESYYGNWKNKDHLSRALTYEKAMEKIHARYPEDHEAAVFYALAILGTALPTDTTYAKQKKAGEILEKIFEREPNHPGAAHYIIHSYDYPELAIRALPAARRYAQIAPAVPHALHMPSHIFTRLGMWQESIQSNLDSAAAAEDYAEKHFRGITWYEEIHALDYLVYAYLQSAQDKEAKDILIQLKDIREVRPLSFAASYSLAAMAARFVLERGMWADAATLHLEPSSFPWNDYPWAQAILYFARGLGQARSGNPAGARNILKNLKHSYNQLREQGQNHWAEQVKLLSQTVAAWIDHAEKNNEEAFKFMRSSADLEDSTKFTLTLGPILPARELLGDLLLELGKPEQALTEFKLALEDSPKRFNALYGAARAAELCGEKEQASNYYLQLEEVSKNASGERIALERAKAFLARMQ